MKLFEFKGVPVFADWSALTGGLFISAFVRFEMPETIFICLGYTFVIVFHELAHALAAHAFSLKVHSVSISGLGGLCCCDVPSSFRAAIVTASAGLFAQLILLVITAIYISVLGWPHSVAGLSIAMTFTVVNGLIMLANLIPEKPQRSAFGTDGYLIWKLLGNKLRGNAYSH